MTTYLAIEPRDPVIARDGRPFGVGSGRRMKSLAWPYPSVVAGSFRTALGKALGGDFGRLLPALKAVEFAGVFPVIDGTLFLPAASDLVVGRSGTCHALRLLRTEGTDLPAGLFPVCPPASASGKFDDDRVPAWWSRARAAAWLAAPSAPPDAFLDATEQFRDPPPVDERTHLAVDPATLAARDGLLFTTAGLVLDESATEGTIQQARLSARVRRHPPAEPFSPIDVLHPVGGERRLARFRDDDPAEAEALWSCPDEVRQALAHVPDVARPLIRMVLATPAIFEGGWGPGWVDPGTLCGAPPGAAAKGLSLTLVAVCIRRWRAISGWSYEAKGQKPTRRLVPAGGVYFFELTAGDPAALADLWLEPVGDELTGDGFGLATWGTWSWGAD